MLASAAGAADLPVKASPYYKAAPMAPVLNWTGLYIGGYAGGAWGNSSFLTVGPPVQLDTDFSGFVGGAYIGYDYQLPNNLVLGARVSVPVVSDLTQTVVYSAGGPPITVDAKAKWAVLVSGTVGYAMGRFMPYVGGGLAVGKIELNPSVIGLSDSDSQTHTGYHVLAGAKYMFADRWSVGVEFDYTSFGKETYNFPKLFGAATGDFNVSSVVGTLDYRF
jgi:outer membrane immunogenic protein